jgi:hypothetical protein
MLSWSSSCWLENPLNPAEALVEAALPEKCVALKPTVRNKVFPVEQIAILEAEMIRVKIPGRTTRSRIPLQIASIRF